METKEQGIRELCDEMVALMKKHNELYDKGLIGVYKGDIHVDEEFLLEIPGEMKLEHRPDTEFPYEYQKTYSGITFFVITKELIIKGGEADGTQS